MTWASCPDYMGSPHRASNASAICSAIGAAVIVCSGSQVSNPLMAPLLFLEGSTPHLLVCSKHGFDEDKTRATTHVVTELCRSACALMISMLSVVIGLQIVVLSLQLSKIVFPRARIPFLQRHWHGSTSFAWQEKGHASNNTCPKTHTRTHT